MSFVVKEGDKLSNIESTKSMKILGVYIDNNLTWETHIKSVKSKTFRIIRNLARTTSVLPLKSRRQLYDALVTPHFSYNDIVWGGMSKGLCADLQKAGNFAAKSLLGMRKKDSATEALIKLNMMPLEDKRTVHLGVFVHKLNQEKGPRQLVDNYKGLIRRNHSYQTRMKTRGVMNSIQHSTSKFEKSTLHRAISTWNSIPNNIRSIDSTSSFKRHYQAHLLAKFKDAFVWK